MSPKEEKQKKAQPAQQHQKLALSSGKGEPSEASKASHFSVPHPFGHPVRQPGTSSITNRMITSQFDSYSHGSTVPSFKRSQRPSVPFHTTSQSMPELMLGPTIKATAAPPSYTIEESHQAFSPPDAGADQQDPLTKGSNGSNRRKSGRKPSEVNGQSQVSSHRNAKKRRMDTPWRCS